jgi:cytochrome P450
MPDLLGFCALLLIAGNVTTTNLIGNAVRCLDQYDDHDRFHANLDGAIRETLRYRPPAQALGRLVTEDTEIDGQPIPEGDHVTIWLGAANHDPSVWDAPEEFRPTRDGPDHLSFGHGIHFCLGAPLAKLEAKIALDRLLDRTSDLRVTASEPEPVRSSFLHGVGELPVAFARDD